MTVHDYSLTLDIALALAGLFFAVYWIKRVPVLEQKIESLEGKIEKLTESLNKTVAALSELRGAFETYKELGAIGRFFGSRSSSKDDDAK